MSDFYSSLLWLTVTVVAFGAMDGLAQRMGRPPWLHPVLMTTPVVILALMLSDTRYEDYSAATALLTFLLGPAVVSLALPIWLQCRAIRRLALPIGLALGAGALTAIVTSVAVMALFGAPQEVLASIAPRATTTPVGIAMSQMLGGLPSLTAVIVVCSGVLGAMLATPLLNGLRIKDYRARGFAVGVSAHGIGASRAFQVSETAGAYAGMGMALNAVATATILSIVASLI